MKKVNKIQLAVNFAGDRSLGGNHGYPSITASMLEEGFLAGYYAKEAEIQKAIESLEESKGFGFNSTARLFTDQQHQMEHASRVERIIKILKQLL